MERYSPIIYYFCNPPTVLVDNLASTNIFPRKRSSRWDDDVDEEDDDDEEENDDDGDDDDDDEEEEEKEEEEDDDDMMITMVGFARRWGGLWNRPAAREPWWCWNSMEMILIFCDDGDDDDDDVDGLRCELSWHLSSWGPFSMEHIERLSLWMGFDNTWWFQI